MHFARTDPPTNCSSTKDASVYHEGRGNNDSDGFAEPAIEEVKREDKRRYYDWRKYAPTTGILRRLRWLMVGGSAYVKQSDEELNHNIKALARCLVLLRTYESLYGMPERGGPRDQEFVLREVYRDLYAGGTPIWALQPVMVKAAEGLTGRPGVNFFLLPRRIFICAPTSGATSMFSTERGFCISKLDAMEQVVVRLASFASNTNAVSSVPSRLPKPVELDIAAQEVSSSFACNHVDEISLAREILNLASDAQGLFFFVNTNDLHQERSTRTTEDARPNDDFWKIESSTCQLFCRLAAIEAMESISKIDAERKELYSPGIILFFKLCSSAGACAIWFNGSWVDMGVAGVLAMLVGLIGRSTILTRQERIIFEVVASFVVGLTAGLIALKWPEHTCFGAMAVAAVLDVLQGFRIVYAVIEIMSKHTVAGGADFLEGILFTGLIAYFLRFGQYFAEFVTSQYDESAFLECRHDGIDQFWYFLFLPLAAVSWSGIFKPNYRDLPLMGFHGILGYLVDYAASRGYEDENLNNFVASLFVTMSAGVISRFTGRQAVGNTVAGIFVLLPGAYLVNALYDGDKNSFFANIILRSIVIGIGAWTGTMICSPTLLGTTGGLLLAQKRPRSGARQREKPIANNAMLFF
jgi:uncharacterized membrane protein YjjP (DUF1212 family)